MPKLKQETIVPTQEEDEAINHGIASDPDTYELSTADIKEMEKICHPKADVPLKKPRAPQ